MKNFFLLGIIFCSLPTFAQSSVNTNLQQFGTESAISADFVPKFNMSPIELKGSRYFNEEYAAGEIWMSRNRHYSTELKYRFDEYENSVQVKYRKGNELLLLPEEIEYFKLYNKTDTLLFFKMQLPGEKNVSKLFMVVYASPAYKLIKLPGKRYRYVNDKIPYGSGERYDEYIDEHRYFIKIGKSAFTEIKPTQKALMKAFPQKREILDRLFSTPEEVKPDDKKKGNLKDFTLAQVLQKIENE